MSRKRGLNDSHRPTDTCWTFQGSLDSDGYGQLKVRGSSVLAHRLAFHLWNGKDPGSSSVMHTCNYPPCVNPDHLVLGTQKENAAQMVSSGRAGAAKLSLEDVRQIRCLVAIGMSRRAVGAMFGVTHDAVACIITGKTWSSFSEHAVVESDEK